MKIQRNEIRLTGKRIIAVQVKMSLCMKQMLIRGEEVQTHSFFISTLERRQVVSFKPQPLYSKGKNCHIHLRVASMGSRAGLYVLEKTQISCPCHKSNPKLSTLLQPCYYTDYAIPASQNGYCSKINLLTTVVTYGRVLSTKRYKDMPLCHDGENYPIKSYYVHILPNVAKIWVETKASKYQKINSK